MNAPEFTMGGEPPPDRRGTRKPYTSAFRKALDAAPGTWASYKSTKASAITYWRRLGYEAVCRKTDDGYVLWVRRPV